jgi:hypothetical protein
LSLAKLQLVKLQLAKSRLAAGRCDSGFVFEDGLSKCFGMSALSGPEISDGSTAWDRFYETPFRPKTFRIFFYLLLIMTIFHPKQTKMYICTRHLWIK